MKYWLSILLWLPALGWASFIPLDPQIERYNLVAQLEYFEDSQGSLSIEQVIAGSQRDSFQHRAQNAANLGWSTSTYWLRFTAINTSDQPQVRILEFNYPLLDRLKAWKVNGMKAIPLGTSGDLTPRAERPIDHYKHSFKFELQGREQASIVLRVQSHSLLKLESNLWTPAAFERQKRNELRYRSLFMGILLGLAAFNLVLSLRFRQSSFAWYGLALANMFTLHAAHSGLGAEWLWPNSIRFADLAPIIFAALNFMAFIAFFRSFLGTRTRAPYIDRAFIAFLWLHGATVPLVFFDYTLAGKILTYSLLPSLALDVFACIYTWYLGFQAARLLLMAWLLYLSAAIFYILSITQLLPPSLADYDYLTAGATLAVLLMGLALADRFNSIQRRHAELKAKLLNETQSSDKLKSAFLATVSHELRTPIHGVKGCLEIIDPEALNDNQRQTLSMAQQSISNLERLVERLLIFSDAVAGKLDADISDCPIRRELARLIDEYRVLYPAVEINWDDSDECPEAVRSDGSKLLMAVQQILDNACRFTGKGQVNISTQVTAGPHSEELVIAIDDTGPGMRKKYVERVCEAFAQIDQSFSRRHGGIGVGLSLTQALVKILGGKFKLTSEWGQGTEVTLKIPVDRICIPAATPLAEVQDQPLRTLIAEDNPVNQKVLAALLKKHHCEVACADNGEQALEMFERDSYDLVFMDCQMPIMDGFDATRGIRQYEQEVRASRPTPIIAVTANVMAGDRERCISAGMNDYLAKPIKPDQLREAILRNLA